MAGRRNDEVARENEFMRTKAVFFIIIVVVATAVAGYFINPQWFDTTYQFQPWRLGLDLTGGSHLVYEVDLSQVSATDKESVLNGLRDVIEKRVNLFGVSEPQVYVAESGQSTRLVVELAGIKDIKAAIEQIGLTPLLYFSEVQGEGETQSFVATNLSGRYVEGAQLTFDSVTNQPQISLSFNSDGAGLFADITTRNVGKQLAVFLDGNLITAPVVQEAIIGGKAQITGDFTIEEAQQLVERFNAGALPAPITLINQQTIGASLGADSLEKTIWAGLIGTSVLLSFMLVYYLTFGLVSGLALVIYIILTLGIFKLFGVTMTLAGIAGFILTIGMAIDANILIFERAKEEIRNGLSRTTAIEEGFKRAWPSIRDSNMTTIITSIILYYFTTGFVKGFALALLIGVIISMFSAITVSRLLLRVFINDNRPSSRASDSESRDLSALSSQE
ncbi:MAG: protein translocase subunit SecD [Patescibacteria group bacterium]